MQLHVFQYLDLFSPYLPILSVTDHHWRTMSVPDRITGKGGGPNLAGIEVMRNHSELFRAECLRLISETDKACKRMQIQDSNQLGE